MIVVTAHKEFNSFMVVNWWITMKYEKDTLYPSLFSPNARKYMPEKLPIWIFFTEWCCWFWINVPIPYPPGNVGKWELKVLNLPNCYGLCLQLYTFFTDYGRPCFWHSTSFSFFHRSQPIQVISRVPNMIKETT